MEAKNVFIYGLIDPETNMLRYIGKSVNPPVRLRQHISKRNKNTHKNKWIQKLIKNNLKPLLMIIDDVPKSEWVFWEIFYISYFNSIGCPLTNSTIGGDGISSQNKETRQKIADSLKGRNGKKHSDLSRLKMSMSQRGRKILESTRQKMSDARKGKPMPWLNDGNRTENHKMNLSKSLKGRTQISKGKTYEELYGKDKSIELKKKLTASHIGIQKGEKHPMFGKTHSQEVKNKLSIHFSKPIIQLSLDGTFIKEWTSIKEASKELRLCGICRCCKGKLKTSGGYKWKYKI